MESLTTSARCSIRQTLVALLLVMVSDSIESFQIRSNYLKSQTGVGICNIFQQLHRNTIIDSTIRATTKRKEFLDEQDFKSFDQNISNSTTTITISYEGQSCDINVQPQESILSALERQSIHIQTQLTTLPDMPFDCRRGNCLTCAALVKDQSVFDTNLKILRTDDNGLSPTLSNHLQDQGYILTCSSFVEPQNESDEATTASSSSSSSSCLHLELGVHNELWNEIYSNRFMTPETQYVARTAIARVLRKSAERNLQEWVQSTEKMLQQTEIE
jgi:ferredoxin